MSEISTEAREEVASMERSRGWRAAVIAVLAASVLVGAGCGGGSSAPVVGDADGQEPRPASTEAVPGELDVEEMQRHRPEGVKTVDHSCDEPVGGSIVTYDEDGEEHTTFFCGTPPPGYEPHGHHGPGD